MALSINWMTKVITVPQADLTLISAGEYELDIGDMWTWLHDIMDDVDGAAHEDCFENTAPKTLSGTTFARVLEIINGYTITFEDLQYRVTLVGGNSNIQDVTNKNQVSVTAIVSGGLVVSQPALTLPQFIALK